MIHLRALRVFELVEYDVRPFNPYCLTRDGLSLLLLQRVVMLDSDMIVMRNMDELMELDLPSDWIAAAHACACNPRKLAHYPEDWWASHCTSTSSLHQLTTVRQDPRELRIHAPQSPEWPFPTIIDPTVQPSSLHSAELRPRRSYAFCNARTIGRRFPSHLAACPHVFLPRSRFPRSLFPRQMETTALGLQRVEDAEGHTQEPMA